MTEVVLSELKDGIRTITLNRPDVLNAMNDELILGAAEAFRAANADPETRVVIFTGAGRAFCAGDDLTVHGEVPDEHALRNTIDALQAVTREVVLGNKVVVGAINGWAVGGGFEWAINCDLPIWGASARAFFPELKWGMFVTGGVTSILPKLVGLTKAKEMIILGERYGAAELLELGLAWRVVPDEGLMDEAREVAGRIAELPNKAVTDFKRVIARASCQDVEAAMALETEAAIRGAVDPDSIARIKEFGG